jgi:hypothetical protein
MRMTAPAAARNRDAILAVLRTHLPSAGTLLEIASGTGEHAAYFAAALPAWQFQPSDPDAERRASIDAWCAGLPNVAPALAFDATAPWTISHADAVLCCNMIHIAPWEATLGLLRNTAALGAMLIIYGPFIQDGVPTAPGNLAFDADLRSRDPRWGLRLVADVVEAAAGYGLVAVEKMPANNLSLILTKVLFL